VARLSAAVRGPPAVTCRQRIVDAEGSGTAVRITALAGDFREKEPRRYFGAITRVQSGDSRRSPEPSAVTMREIEFEREAGDPQRCEPRWDSRNYGSGCARSSRAPPQANKNGALRIAGFPSRRARTGSAGKQPRPTNSPKTGPEHSVFHFIRRHALTSQPRSSPANAPARLTTPTSTA
jgi:hypothetical protein